MRLLALGLVPCLVLASAHGSIAQGESDLTCPPTIRVEEAVGGQYGAWKPWNRNPNAEHDMTGLLFSDGPPEDKVFLEPNTSRRTRFGKVETYDFTPRSYGRIWISCLYDASSVGVSKPTGLKSKRCRLTYDVDGRTRSQNLHCE